MLFTRVLVVGCFGLSGVLLLAVLQCPELWVCVLREILATYVFDWCRIVLNAYLFDSS